MKRQEQPSKQRERERDGMQGCEKRSRKREEGRRRVAEVRSNEINGIPSNAMELGIEKRSAKRAHQHHSLTNSKLARSL